MIDRLRQQLAAADLPDRLRQLAAGAPAAAPVSLTLDLGKLDSDWLHQLPAKTPFWYRARPQRGEFRLGIGHALQISSSGGNRFAALDNAFSGLCSDWRHTAGEPPPLAFAGFAFDAANQNPLPNALLAVPAILLENLAGHCRAVLTVPAGRIAQAIDEWRQLLAQPTRRSNARLLPAAPQALTQRAWTARVNAALRDIAGGRVDKLVLSRSRHVEAAGPFSPALILGQLAEQQPDSLLYAHGQGELCFLGATPERLVRLDNGLAEADALAGTAWSGSLSLAEQKNQHEQSLVVQAVVDALAPLCAAPPQASPAAEHPAGHLTHLRSRISGRVAPGTTLFDLVRALHPTPAVGGYPSAVAQDWLAAHGEQRSGWYSGGFGILTAAGDGEFSVALRCALLHGRQAELQAGAGIVVGSDPQQELAETEAKLGTLLAALGPAGQRDRNGTRD